MKRSSQAMELFEAALAYQWSADKLFTSLPPQPRIGLPLSDPVYFLYHHAAELALKAHLLSHNLRPKKEHRIVKLLQRCRDAALLEPNDEQRQLDFLAGLLDSGDGGKGYRYAGQIGFSPDLKWVQEVVQSLIAEITPHLEDCAKANGLPGPSGPHQVTRIRYTLGKPMSVKQPTPLKPGP